MLEKEQSGGDLETTIDPGRQSIGEQGGGHNRSPQLPHPLGAGGEEPRVASFKSQMRCIQFVVPGAGVGSAPALSEQDSIRPLAANPEAGGLGHVWESMEVEVLYLGHDAFARHLAGELHPERPSRLGAVEAGALASGLSLVRVEPTAADRTALERVHDPRYLDALEAFCAAGGGEIDSDTIAGPDTWQAALLAAGSGLTAVGALAGEPGLAFAAVRPPGHHATPDRAMGFCFLNNLAVCAAALVAQRKRVAVVDWDVHHGNGTQDMFYQSAEVLYLSLHQWGYPFFPLSGSSAETGAGEGIGHTLNFAFPPGSGGDAYRSAFERVLEPVLTRFQPDWLLVSAGYDADTRDPLAELDLDPFDYQWMASTLVRVLPEVPTICFLEGGYDLEAISEGVEGTLRGFGGESPLGGGQRSSPEGAFRAVDQVAEAVKSVWSL